MAMDKNDLTKLITKIPTVFDKELPDLEGKIKWVETQIDEFTRAMYRQVLDLRVAKNYASKDDADAVTVAENKIKEVTGNVKGIKWTLEALRAELDELVAQRKPATAKK